MQLSNRSLLMRTALQGIEEGSYQEKKRANDGIGISSNAIRRNIIAVLVVPDKESNSDYTTQKNYQEALKPDISPGDEEPAIAYFTIVWFTLFDCRHYSPQPARNIRTFSHIIIASR